MPNYNEIVHLPFYIYDPRCPKGSEERHALAQTIDIAPTLLDFFDVAIPKEMQGVSLKHVVQHDEMIHEQILFGNFGGHIHVCDGTYTYMRSSLTSKNQPCFEYTLMPTVMRGFINEKALAQSTLTKEFACFQHQNVLKIPSGSSILSSYRYGNKLFNIKQDYQQKQPLYDIDIELQMIEKMRVAMLASEAPKEQYERIGIMMDRSLTKEELMKQKEERMRRNHVDVPFSLSHNEQAQILMLQDMLPQDVYSNLLTSLTKAHEQKQDITYVIDLYVKDMLEHKALPRKIQQMVTHIIKNAGKIE